MEEMAVGKEETKMDEEERWYISFFLLQKIPGIMQKRKDLFQLLILEVSVQQQMAPLLLGLWQRAFGGGDFSPLGWVRKRGRDQHPVLLFKSAALKHQEPSNGALLLKIPLSLNSMMGWRPNFNMCAFGGPFQIQQ